MKVKKKKQFEAVMICKKRKYQRKMYILNKM